MQLFYNIYRKLYGENDLRSGAVQIGFSTMTMLLLTVLFTGIYGQ
jgi:hypothetical protein